MKEPAVKTCSGCKLPKFPNDFHKQKGTADGRCSRCKVCRAGDAQVAKEARIGDDYQALRTEDFDVGALNPGAHDPRASSEKRQEFSRRMGTFARDLAAGELTDADGAYIAGVGEQERRFQNRRTARTVSLTAANEALHLRQLKAALAEHLGGRITATGYARRAAPATSRTVTLVLSDLHIGAELSERDNPVPFGAVQEARRLEFLLRQVCDYKPRYRATTRCRLILAGDIIEGMLLHDLRDGSPLTEQMVRAWHYLSAMLALLAAEFVDVEVICSPGNHGRNKLRHPGRATSSKWDGVEWQLFYGLKMMASSLKNVTFNLSLAPLTVVETYGMQLGVTHGDTEVKLGHPHTKAEANRATLNAINASRLYGVELDALIAGHYHTPCYQPGRPAMLWNGMLVPPNGHARTSGYIGEQCGQWLFESVPGFLIGDLRYLAVGRAQDDDESLGTIIKPFSL